MSFTFCGFLLCRFDWNLLPPAWSCQTLSLRASLCHFAACPSTGRSCNNLRSRFSTLRCCNKPIGRTRLWFTPVGSSNSSFLGWSRSRARHGLVTQCLKGVHTLVFSPSVFFGTPNNCRCRGRSTVWFLTVVRQSCRSCNFNGNNC